MTRATPHRWAPKVAAATTLMAAWLAVLGILGLSVGGPLHVAFQAHVLCPVDGQLHHVQPSDDLDGAVEESQAPGPGPANPGAREVAQGAHAPHHEGGPSQPHSHDEGPCELGVLSHGTPLVAGSAGLVQGLAVSASPVVDAPALAHAPISLQHLSPSHSPPA